jgi:hypothetical protein
VSRAGGSPNMQQHRAVAWVQLHPYRAFILLGSRAACRLLQGHPLKSSQTADSDKWCPGPPAPRMATPASHSAIAREALLPCARAGSGGGVSEDELATALRRCLYLASRPADARLRQVAAAAYIYLLRVAAGRAGSVDKHAKVCVPRCAVALALAHVAASFKGAGGLEWRGCACACPCTMWLQLPSHRA